MLNLLAFKPDGGRATYIDYATKTAPHLERVGGEVLYFGEGGRRSSRPAAPGMP